MIWFFVCVNRRSARKCRD